MFYYFPKRRFKSACMKKIEPEITDSNEHDNSKLIQAPDKGMQLRKSNLQITMN